MDTASSWATVWSPGLSRNRRIEYLKTPPNKTRLQELLDCMVQHPILMNRPVVLTPLSARLCRPSEAVVDAHGKRV